MARESKPVVSICIPHWQVEELVRICLRAIRKHSQTIPYEVIVVDNGSEDASLDYLRSLSWIRLIERGRQTPEHWVRAFVSALDVGFAQSHGDYFIIMHTDTLIKRGDWLERLMQPMRDDGQCAASGAWKLEPSRPFYDFVKRATDTKKARLWLKRTFGRGEKVKQRKRELCPRDYCAMYRSSVIREHGLTFMGPDKFRGYTAGETMYYQMKENGYRAEVIGTADMMQYMEHLGHATAGLQPTQRSLNHKRAQRKSERKVTRFFNIPEVKALAADVSLDQ